MLIILKKKTRCQQLKQVFLNIVRNAYRAMNRGGQLIVRATPDSEQNGYFRVVIEDTGPGIPQKYLKRIFDPFFSLNEGGVGIGLTISKKIVEYHGGVIAIERRPGRGTKVIVTLPTA